MSNVSTGDALQVIQTFEPEARQGYAPWLGFHNFDHVLREIPYLVKQWAICDTYGIEVDKVETGVAWLRHDYEFGVPGDSGFDSKEARSETLTREELRRKGWAAERIAKVSSPILATALDSDITCVNDLVVVRTDLNNIWGMYPFMARTALVLRREEERMSGKLMTFETLQEKVEDRLGRYLDRDMALTDDERSPDGGDSLPNKTGKANLRRFLNETPESLAEIVRMHVESIR